MERSFGSTPQCHSISAESSVPLIKRELMPQRTPVAAGEAAETHSVHLSHLKPFFHANRSKINRSSAS